MNKRILCALTALVLLCMMLPTMASANTGSMYVKTSNGGSVHLRKAPVAPANNVLTEVPYGAVVDILGYETDQKWAHVSYTSNGKTWTGYMMTRYLVVQKPGPNPKDNPTPSTDTPKMPDFKNFKLVTPYEVIVRPSKPNGYVNFRWAPSYDCRVAMRCYAGYSLTVIAQDGTWAQVSDPQTGYVGFMVRSFLTTVSDGTSVGAVILGD
ncbi:MAG TPA: SH3 domain-containing protein [Candidatus Limiplasma stercoravium]|nr:SH3 domain-containing protein [Candidatus Limiplasma stercoravium]